MTTIGLVIRPGNDRALVTAREVITWAKTNKHTVLLEDESAAALELKGGVSCQDLVASADPIVSLGGDGTLIGVARYVNGRSPILIGVNFGNLGFLTEISPADTIATLELVLAKKVICGERALMSAEVIRSGRVVFSGNAVNDVVIQKGAKAPLKDFDLSMDGEDVARIRADGLILATPTGSTAYSLSAGGSIAHPAIPVVLMTPICPHSLTNRPLILPASSNITIEVPMVEDNDVFVTIDGQVSCDLESGDKISVKQAQQKVKFVRSTKKSYFDILRTKLNWGVPNRSE